MAKLKKLMTYFSKFEMFLWSFSVLMITLSYLIFDKSNHLTFFASLIGITSILLSAKGNPIGQFLMIIFSLFYGFISYSVRYYGEMATYLGMTMPMAVFALISWLKHPYNGRKSEVAVKRLSKAEILFIIPLSALVTAIFYFVLKEFNAANILPSTFSVTTSFLAVYLTFMRSHYFSLAYALNDIVLLVLWTLASFENTKYISVVICFSTFLLNDIYAFISWKKMAEKQKS